MKVVRSAISVGGLTLLSRVCGLVREILLNHVLGSSWMTDAFVMAFKFPNFFRKFLSEGALNAAFVPFFSSVLAHEGPDVARQKAQKIMTVLTLILLAITALVLIGTPIFVRIFAPGFVFTQDRLDLTISLTRITIGYVLFICLSGLLSGILNSLERFAVAAAAPVILNFFMIAALIFGIINDPSDYWIVHLLSWSVLISGVAQFMWLYIALMRKGMTLKFVKPQISDDVKTVMKRMVPGMIGAGVSQINLLIDTILASLLPSGAISYLYYADRLSQLPLSVVGIAIGTALLPTLSKQIRLKNTQGIQESQDSALEWALLLSVPAAVGLMVLSYPIIDLIYGHGASTPADVKAISFALMAFAFGLPAHVTTKVFSTIFFANHDTKTPVKIGVTCVAANLVFNLFLMPLYAHVGLALSTSLAGFLNCGLLFYYLKRKGLFNLSSILISKFIRLGYAATIMGLITYVFKSSLYGIMACESLSCKGNWYEFFAVTFLVLFSAFIFIITSSRLKVFSFQELKKQLRR